LNDVFNLTIFVPFFSAFMRNWRISRTGFPPWRLDLR
jgi:hypothetical protein